MWNAPARTAVVRAGASIPHHRRRDGTCSRACSDRDGGIQRDRAGDREDARRRGLRRDDGRAPPREARGRRRRASPPTASTCTASPRTSPTRAEIKKVVDAHRERYGRLDMLVNNAGVGIGAPVGEIETKRLDMQLDINIRSIVLFYRECLPMLQAAGERAQTRSSSTRHRSRASAERPGCRSTRRPSTRVVGWTEAMNKRTRRPKASSRRRCARRSSTRR